MDARSPLPEYHAGFDRIGHSRNDLVHEGRLSGRKLPNATLQSCSGLVADALDWIDLYLHAVFELGTPRATRFDSNVFQGINAFSLD